MQDRNRDAKVVALGGWPVEGPLLTVSQFEEKHPATRGRMRRYIMRADLGLSTYQALADAVIRLGRSVILDEARVLRWLGTRSRQPRAPARNPHGRAGKGGRK